MKPASLGVTRQGTKTGLSRPLLKAGNGRWRDAQPSGQFCLTQSSIFTQGLQQGMNVSLCDELRCLDLINRFLERLRPQFCRS